MPEWWESAPIVEEDTSDNDWWKSAPIVADEGIKIPKEVSRTKMPILPGIEVSAKQEGRLTSDDLMKKHIQRELANLPRDERPIAAGYEGAIPPEEVSGFYRNPAVNPASIFLPDPETAGPAFERIAKTLGSLGKESALETSGKLAGDALAGGMAVAQPMFPFVAPVFTTVLTGMETAAQHPKVAPIIDPLLSPITSIVKPESEGAKGWSSVADFLALIALAEGPRAARHVKATREARKTTPEIKAVVEEFKKDYPETARAIITKLENKDELTPGQKNIVNNFITKKREKVQVPEESGKKLSELPESEITEMVAGLTDRNSNPRFTEKQVVNMTSDERLYYASGGREGKLPKAKPAGKSKQEELSEAVARVMRGEKKLAQDILLPGPQKPAKEVETEKQQKIIAENITIREKAKEPAQTGFEANIPKPEPPLEEPKPEVPKEEIKPESPKAEAEKEKVAEDVAGSVDQPELKKADVYYFPIDKIKLSEDRFQNRTELNEAKVKDIVENYSESSFNPIIVWRDPKDGETYLLAGHHRLEAAKRLGKKEVKAEYRQGDEKSAIYYATVQSNADRTLEKPYERANIYRKMREEGKTRSEIMGAAERFEMKNSANVINLSFLNPKGKVVESMKTIAEESDSGKEVLIMANWIGSIRRQIPQLTDLHETELFNHLMTNFRERGLRFTRISQFGEYVGRVVDKHTVNGDFDASKPLNFDNFIPKSRNEAEYDESIATARTELVEAQEALNKKQTELIIRKATEKRTAEILKPYEDAIKVNSDRLKYLVENREQELAKIKAQEMSLFDELDKKEGEIENAERAEKRDRDNAEHRGTEGEAGESGRKISAYPGEKKATQRSGTAGETEAYSGQIESLLKPIEKSDFKNSDLDNVSTLRKIGQNLARDINETPGVGLRFGLIKRFRKAIGLYFPHSGMIRLRNINELNVFAHELGHKMDYEVFDLKGKIGFNKLDAIEKVLVLQLGRFKGAKGKLIDRKKLMDNLYKKYGASVVDEVAHRYEMRKELKQFHPRELKEGIAEFVKAYVVDPERAINKAPKFYTFFENLLSANDVLHSALHAARKDFKSYSQQDPRQLYESRIARTDAEGNSWLNGIRKLTGKRGFYYHIIAALKPIRDLSKELNKQNPNLAGYKDPLLQILSVFGVEGKAKQFLENHPFKRTDKGDIEILNDVPGLLNIFGRMIKENGLKEHEGYMAALHDLELMKAGKHQAALFPENVANQTISLFEKKWGKEYADDFTAKLKKYNDALLDYYASSGKLSRGALNKSKELYSYYVPYKRFFAEYESSGDVGKLGKGLSEYSASPVKRIRGSEREILSPFESMIKNTYELLVSADKNIALKTLVDALNEIDPQNVQVIPARLIKPVTVIDRGFIDPITGERYVSLSGVKKELGVFYEKPKNAEVVTVWESGKPVYAQIPKEYFDSFFSAYEPHSQAIRKFAIPTNILRAGAVVYDPTFGFRNIARDQISALFYSKYGYRPHHFLRGIAEAVNKTEYYQKFLASGADISFLASIDKALELSQHRQISSGHLNTLWHRYATPTGLFNLAKDFNRATELGTRVGAFRNAFIKTGDVFKAMEEARSITADYSMIGASMKNISPLYAFLNARMRHAENTIKSFGMKRLPRTVGVGLTHVTPAAVLTWLANNTDDDRRKLYEELPEWRKSLFFNIPIPGTNNFIPVPKGFYGVLFGSTVESFLNWMVNEDPEGIKGIPASLAREISPMSNYIDIAPTSIRPIVEQFAGKLGYSGKQIIPERLKEVSPGEQFTESTPEFLKAIGKSIGVSPSRLEHFITGYTAGAGRNVLYVSDEIMQALGIVDRAPEDKLTVLSKMPIARAFVSPTYIGLKSESIQRFYEKLDELEEINFTVNRMIKDGRPQDLVDYLKPREKDYRYYLENQRQINRFRDIIRGVRLLAYEIKNDPAEGDAAGKIESLNKRLTELARRFNDTYESGKKFNINDEMKDVRLEKRKSEHEKQVDVKRFRKSLLSQ